MDGPWDTFARALTYAAENAPALRAALGRHLQLVALPLAIALAVGLPLGWWSARDRRIAPAVTNAFNGLRAIPSLAVLFVAIPYFGLSFQSAALALTLLVVPPVAIATEVAFRTLDPAAREAARGTGMSAAQQFWWVELPLALPVVLAGIKTATVEAIASATLAAFVGAGGLGDFIVLGFALYDPAILLVGAVPVAGLALAAELTLGGLERLAKPNG